MHTKIVCGGKKLVELTVAVNRDKSHGTHPKYDISRGEYIPEILEEGTGINISTTELKLN